MASEKSAIGFGWRVYGLGVMALGLTCLAFRDFNPGQPVPEHFPARAILALAAGVFMVVAGVAIQWRRATVWSAAALTFYYTLFVLILMNGPVLLAHYAEYGAYEGISMQVAIAAGGLIVYVTTANIDGTLASRLTRLGQLAIGACSLVWGGAHFLYMNLTAPLVPKWLPPTQEFWGYLTGIAFVAAGLAILTGIQARLAAILLTAMIASFGLLANGRALLADPSHWNWTESALNLALIGVAWVVADSLARLRH
jgi:uncharacterized membrane protein YphA (DoxX/SURF4 family)